MPHICGGRSVIAYWILGLCNAYGYVVLLSAAEDILNKFDVYSNEAPAVVNSGRHCNISSTGIILLAEIVPSLLAKTTAPFFPLWMNVRILLVTSTAAVGFVIVSMTNSLFWIITGIIIFSFSRGLGESSLLSYTVFFEDKSVLSAWSSGSGGAGLFGSVTYAALIAGGLSSQMVLFSLLPIPVIMAICFWIVLESPFVEVEEPSETTPIVTLPEAPQNISEESFSSRMDKVPMALKYILPLLVSYYFIYLINQGLFEVSLVESSFCDFNTQYRWYQVCYHIGVFIATSSINLIKIDNMWFLSFLQGLNLVFFSFEALFLFANNIYIIFAMIVWEGLLSGASYVNTFYKIQTEERADDREVITGITLVADNIGIIMSGLTVIAIHHEICNFPR